MQREKVKLTREMETLLIPLYSKAMESKKENPIISDKKAEEVVSGIEYNESALKIPKKTLVTMCMRAKQFDRYTDTFLRKHPNATVLHLGCGLDSRFYRVDNGSVQWYDLDYPQVIELRKKFYPETDRYHLIPSSVTDLQWMNQVKKTSEPILVLMEGLLMYLKEAEVKSLFLTLQQRFPGCQLIFDVYGSLTAKHINHHPSIKKTGATIHWGIDDAHQIEHWNEGFTLEEEWYFTQSPELHKLGLGYSLSFKLANCVKAARKAHYILIFST